MFSKLFINLGYELDNDLGDRIHVENRRISVQTDRMEVVAVTHSDFKDGIPIFFFHSFLNGLKSFFDNMLNTLLLLY